MTNKDLIELNAVLDRVSHIRGKKFAYAVIKNKDIIEKELKYFEEIKKQPHPQYQDYENERTTLCTLHAKKDDNGQPITTPDNKYDIEDMEKFQVEFDDLTSKYKEVIDDLKEAEQQYIDFLNSETTVDLVKVTLDDLPDEVDADFLNSIKHILA